jgi:hypothetical protein
LIRGFDMSKIPDYIPVNKKPATSVYCVACGRLTDIAFASVGKLWTRTGVITKVVEETTYNPLTTKFETLVEEKHIPVEGYAKGICCHACVTADYRMVERKRRNGEVYYIPRWIPDPSATEHTSKNPGYIRERNSSEPELRPVNWRKPATSGNSLYYDPLTSVTYEDASQVHVGGFNKFGSR